MNVGCLFICTLLIGFAGNIVGQKPAKMCAAPKEGILNLFCRQIAIQEADQDENSPYEYKIEQYMEEAACVDRSKDSESERNEKIRAMWVKYNDMMICDGTDFDVSNGYMLKYAVSRKFEHFITLAAESWKVPLNRTDEFDSRTTLDYVQDEWKRYRGTIWEATMKRYYYILSKAGAVHKKRKQEIFWGK